MARSFAGAGVALITPFTKSADLDEAALRRLVRRQMEAGIDVLVPCGTTGESVTMSPREQLRVIERDNLLELGKETVYEIQVQNPGNASATSVQLQVQFPPGLTPKLAEGKTRHAIDRQSRPSRSRCPSFRR